jgi:hypothetical protein
MELRRKRKGDVHFTPARLQQVNCENVWVDAVNDNMCNETIGASHLNSITDV